MVAVIENEYRAKIGVEQAMSVVASDLIPGFESHGVSNKHILPMSK